MYISTRVEGLVLQRLFKGYFSTALQSRLLLIFSLLQLLDVCFYLNSLRKIKLRGKEGERKERRKQRR